MGGGKKPLGESQNVGQFSLMGTQVPVPPPELSAQQPSSSHVGSSGDWLLLPPVPTRLLSTQGWGLAGIPHSPRRAMLNQECLAGLEKGSFSDKGESYWIPELCLLGS